VTADPRAPPECRDAGPAPWHDVRDSRPSFPIAVRRPDLPTLRVVLPLAGGSAVVALVSAMVACLTDPPPDLLLPSEPPRILHDALQPPEGLITQLPANVQFIVPLQIPDPSATCQYQLFVDNVLEQVSSCQETATSNGVATQVVTPRLQLDAAACHTLTFAIGTDSATWRYDPPSCAVYDAGALQTGAFPDGATDALPAVVIESGIDP
jgi:hypothetical protein